MERTFDSIDAAVAAWSRDNTTMSQIIEAPVEVRRPEEDEDIRHDRPWLVIVWNDPINLMSYVTSSSASSSGTRSRRRRS